MAGRDWQGEGTRELPGRWTHSVSCLACCLHLSKLIKLIVQSGLCISLYIYLKKENALCPCKNGQIFSNLKFFQPKGGWIVAALETITKQWPKRKDSDQLPSWKLEICWDMCGTGSKVSSKSQKRQGDKSWLTPDKYDYLQCIWMAQNINVLLS